MQITGGLLLVSALICVALFAMQHRWVLVIAYICLAINTLLDKLLQATNLPPWIANSFAYLFVALTMFELFRTIRARNVSKAQTFFK
jgi:hypothetical protein